MSRVLITLQVQKFLDGICDPISSVLICVGIADADGQAFLKEVQRVAYMAKGRHFSVFVQQVTPWGKFTHALNIATGYAQANGFDYVQFMSLETMVSGTETSIQTANMH